MEILVEFILIAEDFPAVELKERLGIQNCDIDFRGDIKSVGQNGLLSRTETHTSIMYTTGYVETDEVSVPLERMYNMFASKKDIIREYVERYNLESKFCISLILTDNPIIEISKEFVDFASYIHAFIEFDTYVD